MIPSHLPYAPRSPRRDRATGFWVLVVAGCVGWAVLGWVVFG